MIYVYMGVMYAMHYKNCGGKLQIIYLFKK